MSNNNILVIGIAGGTGSGKSTLTKQLVNHFGDQITVLKHDDYYKAHDEMTYEERTHLNYDHPNAFDTELMLQHLRQLKRVNQSIARFMITQFTTEAVIFR